MGGINSKYLSLELIFMFLKFNKINDKLIVALVGELDHHSAEEVRVKIDDRIERDNINKRVDKVFTLSGLYKIITVYRDINEAVESI